MSSSSLPVNQASAKPKTTIVSLAGGIFAFALSAVFAFFLPVPPALPALIAALLCAVAAARLKTFPTRRAGWFVVAFALALGAAAKVEAAVVAMIVLLAAGLLILARPTADSESQEQPDAFDWALAPDAIVIGGAVWIVLQSRGLGATSLAAAGALMLIALLTVAVREMRPSVTSVHAASGDPSAPWKSTWLLLMLAAFLMAGGRLFGAGFSQKIQVLLSSSSLLLCAVAALHESFSLAGHVPAAAQPWLGPQAARWFWLRNFAPLCFAGIAVAANRSSLAIALLGLALVRQAIDSLLNTRQTFADYSSWNQVASDLRHDVAARTNELSTLHAVAADLSNTQDSTRILATALDRMMNSLRADAGAIWLYRGEEEKSGPMAMAPSGDDQAADRRSRAATEPVTGPTTAAAIRRALVESLLAQLMGTDRPEWLPKGNRWHLSYAAGDDPTAMRGEEQRRALSSLHQGFDQGGLANAHIVCRSLKNNFDGALAVEIQSKGETLGAMAVLRAKGPFAHEESALLQSLTLEVASALQNAHLYQEALRLADRDKLTDLLNHRAVQQQLTVSLSRAIRTRDQFVILTMDLNNFKFFNDTYGHEIGDEVLRRSAECLRQSCRISDVLGRYGGDEFIAVLLDTDYDGAKVVVDRIEKFLGEKALDTGDGRRIPISMSFGAAIFPLDGETALELLGVAETNVSEAKHKGGGFVVRSHAEESEELKALKTASVGGSFGVLDALVTAIDNKDNYTRHHSEDVARWAVMIAKQLDYSQEQQRSIRICGLLHDVGKIAVPDSILRKPGRLSDDEFKIMQQHPVFGALIVKDVPNLNEVLGGIRHHHERFDGKGYPDRITGEEIPLFGRILAVPDCFSAMTTNRPYRQGLSWDEAIAEIERGRGTQFDPDMADAFIAGLLEIRESEQAALAAAAEKAAADPNAIPEEKIGDTGFFMNMKPRSVADAEEDSAAKV